MSSAPSLPGLGAVYGPRWRPALVALLLVLVLHALLLALLPIGAGAGFDGGVRAWMQARQIVLPAVVAPAPVQPPPAAPAVRKPRAEAAAPAAVAAPEPQTSTPAAEAMPAEPQVTETAQPAESAASAVATVEPTVAPEAGGQALPTFATRIPPAAVLRFELRRGTLTGDGEMVWQPRADGYALAMNASVFGLPLLNWSSQGGFDSDGLAPERFVDRRRNRDVRAANFQRDKGLISFSGPPIAYPLLPGSQDRLSWMVQLPAIIEAAPATFVPGARIPVFVAGARGDADLWTFTVEGIEPVDVVDGQVAGALRLLREPRKPFDTRVEVWLDPARHHLPVRLRLTLPQSGDSNEFVLREMNLAP